VYVLELRSLVLYCNFCTLSNYLTNFRPVLLGAPLQLGSLSSLMG